ncbi:MAG: NifU family protein [Actinomycetota bacterium]|nr:NifU family protein [Actinomycetota bacterium]
MARTAAQLAVVTLTPEARRVVREALSEEPDPDRLALWLEVRGVRQAEFVYDLYFQAVADAGDDDAVVDDEDLTVVVPKSSVDRLRGARLEWNSEGEGGLVLINPNVPEPEELGVPAEVMAAGLGGPLGSRVSAVLEQAVNPSIAAHGGRADLVAIDESGGVAYLRLSGGCQGCAMSRMTLTQGIEAALREEVPELSRVVDVTDHAGGANPYY